MTSHPTRESSSSPFSCRAITALAFGLAPAILSARTVPGASLRGGAGATSGSQSPRGQRLLVVGQLAMSLVLLVATGAFVSSVAQAGRTHPGFDTNDRITLSLDLKMQRYTDARARRSNATSSPAWRRCQGCAAPPWPSTFPLAAWRSSRPTTRRAARSIRRHESRRRRSTAWGQASSKRCGCRSDADGPSLLPTSRLTIESRSSARGWPPTSRPTATRSAHA